MAKSKLNASYRIKLKNEPKKTLQFLKEYRIKAKNS